jgi:hypothetical protein
MQTSRSPFNGPLETGMRALAILTATYPQSLDLNRLVDFDYLVVHSGDVGGPKSLHAPLPMRNGELIVRRMPVEKGLALMISRGLVKRITTDHGIEYLADDSAKPFLSALKSEYSMRLQERANWVASKYAHLPYEAMRVEIRGILRNWVTQFQSIEKPGVRS